MGIFSSRTGRRVLAAVAGLAFMGQALPGFAQGAPVPSNLDLSSGNRHETSVSDLGGQTVQIRVSNYNRDVTSTTKLTPAEQVAVWQVLSSGAQSIKIDAMGKANGGNFTIPSAVATELTGLVIPKNVTTFNTGSVLSVLGNLTNYGTLQTLATVTNVGGASISANNIYNGVGALISSNVAMNLSAIGNIVNHGQITSVSNLTVNAGGSIVNGLPAGMTGPAALMSAGGSLNIFTQNLVNSGVINALAGNLNIATQTAANMVINNAGGQLIAANGNVNVRDALFSGKFNVDLLGGDVISKQLNIWSDTGIVEVDVNKLTGVLNVDAGIVHATAHTDDLLLGNMNIKGDPTFFNPTGNITITSGISISAALAIIASGDVTATGGFIDTTSGQTSAGFPVLVIAGANMTPSTGGTGTGTGSPDTTTVVTVNGASLTGGLVDLSLMTNGMLAPINTAPSAGGAAPVTVIAYGGTGLNSGTINVPNINTGGGAGGNNGDVILVAGAKNDPVGGAAITTSQIDTTNGGLGGVIGGAIYMFTAPPQLSNFSVLDGNIQGANTATLGLTDLARTSIAAGSLITNQAPINLVAGKDITLGGSLITAGSTTSTVGPGGDINVLALRNVTSTGAFLIQTTNTAGGNVNMIAGTDTTPALLLSFDYGTFSTTGTFSFDVENIGDVVPTGGNINLGSTLVNTIGTAGMGGNVNLIAYSGASAPTTTGLVTVTGLMTTAGNGTGFYNGNVTVLGGSTTTGTAVTLGAIDTSGGTSGAGNILVATAQPATFSNYDYSSTSNTGLADINGAFAPGALTGAGAVVGNLTANGATQPLGNLIGGDVQTTSVSVRAGSTLTIGSVLVANSSLPAGNTGGFSGAGTPSTSILLSSGGVMTFTPSAVIDNSAMGAPIAPVSGDNLGVDGGSITIKASSFNTQSSTVTVSANGFNAMSVGGYEPTTGFGGSGGQISIEQTSTTAPMTIGANALNISAQGGSTGGNGGSVTLKSGQNIAVTNTANLNVNPQLGNSFNPAAIVVPSTTNGFAPTTGNGGSIDMTANGNVAIAGTLSANGAASTLVPATGGNLGGSGGSISITSNSTTAFNIGGAGVNGVTGSLTANGNVGSTPSNGSGGSITVVNKGTGGILFNGANIQVQAAPAVDANMMLTGYTAGAGGNVSLQAPNGQVDGTGSLTVNGGSSSTTIASGNGGRIEVITNSAVPFVVDPTATTNGITGTVSANGNVGAAPTAASGLNVYNPTGNGGSISFTNLGTGGVFIGTGGISVAAANSDSNNPNATGHNNAGNGGSITLNAPKGPVLSLASLSVNGGNPTSFAGALQNDGGFGGTIKITSSSATQFRVGAGADGPTSQVAGTGNGVLGTLSANGYSGGTISITNNAAGGIRIGQSVGVLAISAATNLPAGPDSNLQSPNGGAGGNIALIAPLGPVLLTNNLDVSGSNTVGPATFQAGGFGGSIYILTNSSTAFNITGNPGTAATINGISGILSANGGAGTAFNGGGGTIAVVNLGKGGITVAQTAGLSVTAAIGTASADGGNGGNIALTAPLGPVVVLGSINVNAGTGTTTSAANDPYQSTELSTRTISSNPPTTGTASGLGGSIRIVTGSSAMFTIGTSATPTNGVSGSLSANGWNGGTISVSSSLGGITVDGTDVSVAADDANPTIYFFSNQRFQGGAGGNLTFEAPNGLVNIQGGLSVNGGGSAVTFLGDFFPGGPGGSISIVTGSSQAFTVGGAAINTNGSSGVLSLNGTGAGRLSITNNKNGGILLNPTGVSMATTVGTPTNPATQYTVTFTNPANMVQDFAGSGYGGDGGSLYLNATGSGGNVFIGQQSGLSFSVDGGFGPVLTGNPGVISIVTNSSSAFNLGAAVAGPPGKPSNGTAGNLSAQGLNGGTIGVTNLGTGGVSFLPTAIQVAATDPTQGNGGNISLSAPNGTLANQTAGTLAANGITGSTNDNSNGGTITLDASLINTAAGILTLQAQGDQSGMTGAGGLVVIRQSSTKTGLTLGNTTNLRVNVDGSGGTGNGGTIIVTAPSGITINGGLSTSQLSATQTGRMVLDTSGGTGSIITNFNSVSTGDLVLNTNSGSIGYFITIPPSFKIPVPLDMNVATVTAFSNSGAILLQNSTPLDVTEVVTKGNAQVSISTPTILNVNGVVSSLGPVALSANGGTSASNITIDGIISGSSINLLAIGNGSAGGGIATTSEALLFGANSVSVTAGAGGALFIAITPQLLIDVTGNGTSTNVQAVVVGNTVVNAASSTGIQTMGILGQLGSLTVGSVTGAQILQISASSNLNVSGTIGAGTATSQVLMGAQGGIFQAAGSVINANTIGLQTFGFSIGSSAAPVSVNVIPNAGTPGTLTVGTAFVLGFANTGSVFVNNTNAAGLVLGPSITAGALQVSSNGGITVAGNLNSSSGSVTLLNSNTTTGDIVVNAGLSLIAGGGPLMLQNNNLTGAINVGANAILTGNAIRVDNNPASFLTTGVALISGAFPGAVTPGMAPGTVTVNTSGPFTVSFNASSINAPTSPVTVNATGANVVFNGNNAGTITVDQGTVITAAATTQSISSLDLTNATVVAALVALQTQGTGVTGTLITSGGKATGGNIIFDQSVSLQNVQALNVPANVTVQFANFGGNDGVMINTPSNAKTNALISGNVQFVGTNNFSSLGTLTVNSALAGQVVTINTGGQLTSDTSMQLQTSGSVTMNGTMTANNFLALILNSSTGVGTPSTSLNAPGTLLVNGNITSTLDVVAIGTNGSIIQTKGVISGPVTSLNTGANTLGYKPTTLTVNAVKADLALFQSLGSSLSAVGTTNMNVKDLFVASLGTATISQLTPLALGGTFFGPSTVSAPSIRVEDGILCQSCTFNTSSFTNVGELTTLHGLGTIKINSTGSLNLNVVGTETQVLGGVETVVTGLFNTGAGMQINSPGGALTVNGGTFTNERGAMTFTSKTTLVMDSVSVTSGILNSLYPPGYTVSPLYIESIGSLNITGGTSASLTGANVFQAVGSNLAVLALKGEAAVQGTYETFGGNIFVTAANSIKGTNLTMTANAAGTTANNVIGGNLFLQAGSTASPIFSTGVTAAPGRQPGAPLFMQADGSLAPLGSNLSLTNTLDNFLPIGNIQQGLAAGAQINLGNSTTAQSLIMLTGGSMNFNSGSATANITIDGAFLTTNSLRPIAFVTPVAPGAESMFDHELVETVAVAAGVDQVAHVFAPGHNGACVLTGKSAATKSAVTVKRGSDMFLRPMRDVTFKSAHAMVHAKKGALLSISHDESGLRVAACSGPGHVKVIAGGRSISMHPGQEIVISNHALSAEEQGKSDGIGRRRFESCAIADGLHVSTCDFSVISMLSNAEHLQPIKHPRTALEKRIANELMMWAAALSVVTGKHGVYTARPIEKPSTNNASVYTPVGYQQ